MKSSNINLRARAVRLIAARGCRGLTIEKMLGVLGVSRSTLEREFLANAGKTPGEELIRVRIERAKELLATTNLPVKNVARLVGYRTTAGFGDFFSRHSGHSPRAFRQLSSAGPGVFRPDRAQSGSKSPQMPRIDASAIQNMPDFAGSAAFCRPYSGVLRESGVAVASQVPACQPNIEDVLLNWVNDAMELRQRPSYEIQFDPMMH